jgi:hypothetical protein
MVLIDEMNGRPGGVNLHDLAQLGMSSEPGRGVPARPSTNLLGGGGIAGLAQGLSGLNLGGGIRPPGTSQASGGSPFNLLQVILNELKDFGVLRTFNSFECF